MDKFLAIKIEVNKEPLKNQYNLTFFFLPFPCHTDIVGSRTSKHKSESFEDKVEKREERRGGGC